MRALVAGSTGLVGKHLVRALLESKQVDSVAALTRRPLAFSDVKLTSVVVDFDKLDAAALPGCDAVFCCLGTTIRKAGSQAAFRRVDLEYPLALARSAFAQGAKQYLLVSSIGAESGSPNFYLRTKAELEDAVSAIGYERVHLFRPSFLLGERAESRTGERIGIAAARAFGFLLAGPLRKYHAVEASDVARAMLAASLTGAIGRRVYEYSAIRELAEKA